ncbi:hypothetical protein DL767_007352 [Monosporascus sp. MG133]|nr:hypothetical protein DL767_007352 [Monosporascus sp. MG133]
MPHIVIPRLSWSSYLISSRSSQGTDCGHLANVESTIGHTILRAATPPAPRKINASFDFITLPSGYCNASKFRSYQYRGIPERNIVGAGHSGRIAEAPSSLHLSFAFQRIGDGE